METYEEKRLTILAPAQPLFNVVAPPNTPLKIKRTGKMIKIESKNALRRLKFDTEIAKL